MKSIRTFLSADTGGASAVAEPAAAETAAEAAPVDTQAVETPPAVEAAAEEPIGSKGAVEPDAWRARALEIELEIEAHDKRLSALNADLDEIKRKIKCEEAEREQKVTEMRACIKGESLTLFDQQVMEPQEEKKKRGRKPKNEESGDAAAETTTPPTTAAATSNLPYQQVKLLDVVSEAGAKLRKNAIAALERMELATIGDYEKFCASGKGLDDIKGLGEGGKQTLEDALDAFWVKHPPESRVAAPAAEVEPTAKTVTPGVAPYSDFGYNVNDLASALESGETIGLKDSDGRIPNGDYVVIGRAGENFTLLPALTKPQWDEVVGKWEREHKSDPPGDRAGKTVKVGADDRYVGSTDLAITLTGDVAAASPEAPTVVHPFAEFGFEPGQLAQVAVTTILANASVSGGGGSVPVLIGTIADEGKRYVVTPAGNGHPDNVYALRPLTATQDDREADESDPYYGRRVSYEGVQYDIGRSADSILVADQA